MSTTGWIFAGEYPTFLIEQHRFTVQEATIVRSAHQKVSRARPLPILGDATRQQPHHQASHGHTLYRGEHSVPIGPSPVLIGRHPGCDVVLGDRAVSALHAIVMASDEGVRIVDCQSTNGTRMFGRRITDVHVQHATVCVGETVLTIKPHVPTHAELPSPQMRELYEHVRRVALSDASVVLIGPTGAGKEAIAQMLHHESGRPGGFVSLNAATLRPALASSELFGHVRGSFTGANRDRAGAFTNAHHGTLFLDELADMPLSVQADLLRAVEQQRIRPVGANEEIATDVRIVGATHHDLPQRIKEGRFREDLWHRLAVIRVDIPPLNTRPQDIRHIAQNFLRQHYPTLALHPDALRLLLRRPWPGNIRELVNTLHRACLMVEGNVVTERHLRETQLDHPGPLMPQTVQQTILRAWEDQGRSASKAADILGVHRSTVYRHLQRAGVALESR